MTDEITQRFTPFLETLTLVPGSRGVFEVDIGGERVYSKKATGRHAEPGEVVEKIEEFLRRQ